MEKKSGFEIMPAGVSHNRKRVFLAIFSRRNIGTAKKENTHRIVKYFSEQCSAVIFTKKILFV